jgi:hypothetical protein
MTPQEKPAEAAANATPPTAGQAKPLSFRKNPFRFSWAFAKEIFGEHEFWLNTLAVRGGAGAIVAGGAVVVGMTVGLPLALTAAAIAGLGIIASVGIYCIAAGGLQAAQGVRRAYHRACGKPEKEQPPVAVKTLQQRLAERPLVKKWLESKTGKKITQSRAWAMAKKVTQEENIVGGMAIGGSVLALAVGIPLLATQIMVLPVIAAGTLLTAGMVIAVSSVSSGLTGLYFSITGLRHQMHRKRAETQTRNAAPIQPQISQPQSAPMPAAGQLSKDFDAEVKPAASHRPPAANRPIGTAESVLGGPG